MKKRNGDALQMNQIYDDFTTEVELSYSPLKTGCNWVLSKKIVAHELLERACVVTITL